MTLRVAFVLIFPSLHQLGGKIRKVGLRHYSSEVLILLPPSAKMRAGEGGLQFNLDSLVFPSQLRFRRRELMERSDFGNVNAKNWALPAIDLFSGVLYQFLDFRTLPESAQKRGETEILIFSDLFGLLRPSDLTPVHPKKSIVSIKSSEWNDLLPNLLDPLEKKLIVDCRSSTYLGFWKPNPAITVSIRVFQESEGQRSVITHMSKKYRGELARLLLQNQAPKNPSELLAIAETSFKAELKKVDGSHPWQLDLLIPG
jgi:cytoplasmic iron level regulating protein YaaA (DUF328/UPF0246 family)